MTLDEIAIKHGCDKSSIHHDYCRIYEQYLHQYHDLWWYSNKTISLLEIGYGGYDDPDKGGESARMWADYLRPIDGRTIDRRPSITITDIYPKNNVPEGVNFVLDDITIPREYDPNNNPKFDIIIDDGSHLNADIIAAFKNLWPLLNPGGLYCVEDVHSSYLDYYPDSHPRPGAEGTAMQFFTKLSHSVNIDFILPHFAESEGLYKDIEFLHFYRDLIIIKKKAA